MRSDGCLPRNCGAAEAVRGGGEPDRRGRPVGTDYVAKAAPDGHTILVMESSAVLHKWLHKSVPFDIIADFTPVARVATRR